MCGNKAPYGGVAEGNECCVILIMLGYPRSSKCCLNSAYALLSCLDCFFTLTILGPVVAHFNTSTSETLLSVTLALLLPPPPPAPRPGLSVHTLPFFPSPFPEAISSFLASFQQLPIQPTASHFSSAWIESLSSAPALPVIPQPCEKPSTVCTPAITLSRAACYCWRRSGSWLHYKAWPTSPRWAPRAVRPSFYTSISHFFQRLFQILPISSYPLPDSCLQSPPSSTSLWILMN